MYCIFKTIFYTVSIPFQKLKNLVFGQLFRILIHCVARCAIQDPNICLYAQILTALRAALIIFRRFVSVISRVCADV